MEEDTPATLRATRKKDSKERALHRHITTPDHRNIKEVQSIVRIPPFKDEQLKFGSAKRGPTDVIEESTYNPWNRAERMGTTLKDKLTIDCLQQKAFANTGPTDIIEESTFDGSATMEITPSYVAAIDDRTEETFANTGPTDSIEESTFYGSATMETTLLDRAAIDDRTEKTFANTGS
ncbi:unnamed protein product [Mytilus coruscus]|uniref:Uncharacterized protein n=1 Tax=Mytilus coruscus TaxID=42192 RepID=A0A6J8B2P0_MYTCO|nr:unnamed protein product [Mytilus coruscus]